MKKVKESLEEYAGGKPMSNPKERKQELIINRIKVYANLLIKDNEKILDDAEKDNIELFAGNDYDVDYDLVAAERSIEIGNELLDIIK